MCNRVDRGSALELPELPVETSAAGEANCLGYTQMPGLGITKLSKLRAFLMRRGLSTARSSSSRCSLRNEQTR